MQRTRPGFAWSLAADLSVLRTFPESSGAEPMTSERRSLPSALRIVGWCVTPGVWFLAVRLGWEATVLTARAGPQMIGFSFMHTSPLALPVILSAFMAQLWVLSAGAWVVYTLLSPSSAVQRMPSSVFSGLGRLTPESWHYI